MRRPLTMLGVLAALALGAGASSAATPPAGSGFVHRITNPVHAADPRQPMDLRRRQGRPEPARRGHGHPRVRSGSYGYRR